MSKTMSPMTVSQYQLQLLDKEVLWKTSKRRRKMRAIHELIISNELRDYQIRYYEKLCDNQLLHSLVCIPTGGGKTRLAVVYLINNALKENQKVLWVTHSQYLLNQAYDTFKSYLGSEYMNKYAILIHSGNHENAIVRKTKDITNEHQLIFCSFQSLQRATIDWKSSIGKQAYIVVDEAHHFVAPEYLQVLNEYTDDKNLIGLTATPIRMKKTETSELYKVFNIDLGVRVHMTELFQKKYLVKPLFEMVNYDNEQLEYDEITKIDELDEWLVENSDDYNNKIIDKYLSDTTKYGKTVVFAINKNHANSLYESFCKQYDKNKVFLVYSDLKKNDELPSLQYGETRETQFNSFKNSRDGILININVLNEGVDIPDIQSIFLTKPLNSKIIVTQIIGRALRTAENKKCAYIVNFAVSSLGRKLLMVMPKTVYNQYIAEWEGEEVADQFEEDEERITKLEEMVEKAKRKAEVCSFSDICLAGNYTLIRRNEQEDFPVPVSFKEYRRIEHFRSAVKEERNASFPKRLFFNETDAQVIQTAFENEGKEYDIVFKAYDNDLLDAVSSLLLSVKDKVKEYYFSKKQRIDYLELFRLKYEELNRKQNAVMLWYLNQVGIRTELDFIYFMKQELPEIKKQMKEER